DHPLPRRPPQLLGPAVRPRARGGDARAQARDSRAVPRPQLRQRPRVPPGIPAVGQPAVAGKGRRAGATEAAVSGLSPLASFRLAPMWGSAALVADAAPGLGCSVWGRVYPGRRSGSAALVADAAPRLGCSVWGRVYPGRRSARLLLALRPTSAGRHKAG